MGRMKYTTESFTTWLEQAFLTVIKMVKRVDFNKETSAGVYRFRPLSAVDNTSSHFS